VCTLHTAQCTLPFVVSEEAKWRYQWRYQAEVEVLISAVIRMRHESGQLYTRSSIGDAVHRCALEALLPAIDGQNFVNLYNAVDSRCLMRA
jgi:hypothetical protein